MKEKMITIKTYSNLNTEVTTIIERFHHLSKIPPINTTPHFYKMFDQYLIGDWKPFFITVYRGDDCIGMLPLMHLNYKRKGILPYRKLKFFGAISSDFCDIIADKNQKETVIKESLKWLFSNKLRWEELVLDDLLDTTEIIEPIKNILTDAKLNFEHRIGNYFHINLNQPWEDVKNGMSKSFVFKNLRLAKNRITNAGKWEIIFNPTICAKEIITRVKEIHIKRQKVLNRSSRFENENDLQFFEQIIDKSLKNNEFQTFWLRFEDIDIAYMLGFYKNNCFYWWNTAFDPKYERFYPTRLLQYNVIEYMYNNAYNEFNFMRGESDYKDKWTKTTRNNHRFIIKNNKSIFGKLLLVLDEIYSK